MIPPGPESGTQDTNVVGEPTLDLRQRLRARVEVMHVDVALLEEQRAPLTPPGQLGNEIKRRGELDVDLQPLLERHELAQHCIGLRLQP